MAWIESHQALGHHPKTIALAKALHCNLPCAVGYLQFLWWWALDYAQDGIVQAGTRPLVARACHWYGKPERFWIALIDTGFADIVDVGAETAAIHDWSDYAGRLIDVRRKDAERKRESRRTSGTASGGRPAYPTQPDTTNRTNRTGHNQPDTTQPEKTAGRQRAGASAPETDPKLLAEHLELMARSRASRAEPGQPESKHSLNGETDDAQR